MSNILNAIRAAVLPGTAADALVDDIEGETGALASIAETPPVTAKNNGENMSVLQTSTSQVRAAGGANAATTASGAGTNETFKAAMDRVNAVLGADGIKGDASRMTAAIELAAAAPEMTAEAVTTFVKANVEATSTPAPSVPATAAGAGAATSYEQQRVAAANLAMPGGGTSSAAGAKIDRDAIFAARRNQQKES